MHFSHVKPGETPYCDKGLRDFFTYRDLGIKDSSDGKVIMHLVKANKQSTGGTGWHTHDANLHVMVMQKGWAKFMFGNVETLVNTGDVVNLTGVKHFLYDYSEDMEFLEIVSPADFGTMDCVPPANAKVPAPAPW